MGYIAPEKVSCVASIGGGPIGGGWAAHFLARGYDVNLYLHDASEEPAFQTILETAWKSLSALGLHPAASLDRLRIVTNLKDALDGAEFIQESAPENLGLKQKHVLPLTIIRGWKKTLT